MQEAQKSQMANMEKTKAQAAADHEVTDAKGQVKFTGEEKNIKIQTVGVGTITGTQQAI